MLRFRFCLLFLVTTVWLVEASLHDVVSQDKTPSAPLPSNGAAVDEVVVESSLYIKPKPKSNSRRTRSLSVAQNLINAHRSPLIASLVEHKRTKRHPQPQRRHPQQQQQQYGQSQAAANAAANSQHFSPYGFGSSAANAQSQAFNAQGPAGSFGASSAGSVTQALNANRFGAQNSAGASMSQVYNLPNGQTINFASTNSFANGPGGNNANSRGSAVSVGHT